MGLRRTGPTSAPGDEPDGTLAAPPSLNAETVAERRQAARDLANHPESALQLGERLLDETDPSVRDALFSSLGHHASDAAAAALIPLLRSEDAALRNGAIETLACMPEAVAPRMQQLLRDADPDVRIFAVNLLVDLQHPEVASWLVDVLAREDQVNVVAAAVDVLAEIGGPEHHPVLRALNVRFPDDPFIAFAVDMAISRSEAA